VKPARAPTWPWLQPAQDRWLDAMGTGRLPHAVLVVGPAGIGKRSVADWIAAAMLCESPDRGGACGRCAACALVAASTHPDLSTCGIEEDAASIKVEQIRSLCERFTLKSYRGGRKVSIIDPADALTLSAFNALLKTLEEPPEESLLLLVVTRLERLPVTIVSRCQRLTIMTPARQVALTWLQEQETRADWPLLLDLAAGVPARAAQLAEAGIERVYRDVENALLSGGIDATSMGQTWAKDRPADRLRCLEHCLAAVARQAVSSEPVNNSRRDSLPSSVRLPDSRSVVRLLDSVRETTGRIDGPLNAQLLFESLLVRVRQVFG
jgi:DNA polymerase-3 subunit delta'